MRNKYCKLCDKDHLSSFYVRLNFNNHWLNRRWEYDVEDEEGMIIGTRVDWEPITWFDCFFHKTAITLTLLNFTFNFWWGWKPHFPDDIIPVEHLIPLVTYLPEQKPYWSQVTGMGELMDAMMKEGE